MLGGHSVSWARMDGGAARRLLQSEGFVWLSVQWKLSPLRRARVSVSYRSRVKTTLIVVSTSVGSLLSVNGL